METILLKNTGSDDNFFPSTSLSFFPFFLIHSWCEMLKSKSKREEKVVWKVSPYFGYLQDNVEWEL